MCGYDNDVTYIVYEMQGQELNLFAYARNNSIALQSSACCLSD